MQTKPQKPERAKTLIVLGHQSYTGAKSRRLCFSKAQAIRVLRNRGCTRNEARDQINRESSEHTRKGWIDIDKFDYVECAIYVNQLPCGWLGTFEQLRTEWQQRPEF